MPARAIRGRRRAAALLVATTAALAPVTLAAWSTPGPAGAGPIGSGAVAAAPSARGDMVGSARCGECHVPEWEAWRASAHVGTIGVADETTVQADFDLGTDGTPASITGPTWPQPRGASTALEVSVTLVRKDGRYWALFEEADDFIARNFAPTAGGSYAFALDFTLGKLFYQGFLSRLPNGEIYVTPLMWDIGERRWLLAGWRPFATDCAHCHLTGMELQEQASGSAGHSPGTVPPRYVSMPIEWLEASVGCEICHGPGAEHAALPSSDNIVDPAGLDKRAQADLCGVCHGMGVANAQSYRPGDPVDPPMTTAEVPAGSRINGFWPTGQHKSYFTLYQGHLASPHWLRAGMSCAPCHDPHAGGTRFPVDTNEQCTLCHTGYKLRLEQHTKHAADTPASRCVACHMPRNNAFTLVPNVVLMQHVSSHNVTLPDPGVNLRYGVPDACTLCHQEGAEWAVERREALWGPIADR